MRLRDKFAIGFMFILGFVVIAASSRSTSPCLVHCLPNLPSQPGIQAYYNKQSDIMLAATASMVELSAGLIGTSLFALCKPILGKHAFQASLAPRRHGLASSHRQAHLNELELLEAYKNEKNAGIRRSISMSGANGVGANGSLNSGHRMSTASKDSLVLPGQFHVGVSVDRITSHDDAHADSIEKMTACVDIDELCQDMKSETESVKMKSPAPEVWFAA